MVNLGRAAVIGYSTTVVAPEQIERLVAREPTVIEICGLGQQHWRDVKQYIANLPLKVGLHCPIPFDGWVSHFEITGPDAARQEQAFDLVRRTLDSAAEIGAAYVNVHFPTVLACHGDSALRPELASSLAMRAASRLSQLSERYGIQILLENVGPNPYFSLSHDFVRVFEAFPNLKMCLDFGHAHVASAAESVYCFAEVVAPYVESMHVYNATPQQYRVGFHSPPTPDQDERGGWMDLERLLGLVARNGRCAQLVFEYSAAHSEDEQAVRWSIEQISSTWRELCATRG